jgi:hypothetical protein
MDRDRSFLRSSPLILPALAILGAFGLWYLATRAESLPSAGVRLPGGQLDELRSKQIDIVIDRAKLYVAWALGLSGAIGFFLKALVDGDVSLHRKELVRIEAALVLMVASIVFGEIVISNVLNMLAFEQFSAESPYIQRYAILQYWVLVAGVAFAGAFIHSFFWRWLSEKGGPLQDAGGAPRDVGQPGRA